MAVVNPELSRRVAAALAGSSEVDFPDRAIIAELTHTATGFDALPTWLQTLVLRHETSNV